MTNNSMLMVSMSFQSYLSTFEDILVNICILSKCEMHAAPGEKKLHQLNEQFSVEALLREQNTNVDASDPDLVLMPPIIMPPTISQIPDTHLLPEGRGGAVVGTIIGGA